MRLTRLFALTLSLLILPAEAARELSWDDLVPAGTGHLYGMPPAQHNGLQSEDQAPANPLTQSMANAPTVAELDGQEVKLPGYVVPLNVDPSQRVTEFLLVPYFGACIHVPPPPSNQIVHVDDADQLFAVRYEQDRNGVIVHQGQSLCCRHGRLGGDRTR